MIEVYSWATPNGHKVHIMLEECGLPYRAIPIDIGAGDQFEPEFLAISPNNKIPAIVDPDGPDGKPISLFESGAILLYLAGKTGRFLPADTRGRYDAAVADVPDGQRRPDARPGAPLPPLRAGEDPLRDRPLHQRGQAPLRRDGQAAGRARTSPATTTASPTSRSSRGCARGRTRASPGTTTRTSRAGSTRSPRARRCSAASRCSPRSASRSRRQGARGAVRRHAVPAALVGRAWPRAMRQSIRSEPAMFECSVQT